MQKISIYMFLMIIMTDMLTFPASAEEPLSGRKVTVFTNQPHLRAAEALAKWIYEDRGMIIRNVVLNYDEALRYTLNDISSASPQADVIMLWYADLGAMVEKQVLADLSEFIETNRSIIKPEDFIPSIYDAYSLYKGRRWALPYDGDTHLLFYRKSLLKKYKLQPPETWDDYLSIAKTITENEKANGIYGTAIMAPRAAMIVVSSFMNRLAGFGGKMTDDNGNPVINSKESVQALSAMIEHSRYALPSPLETDWEVSRDAFLSGKVAMAEQWTDIGIMAEDPAQSLIRGDWGAVQMPRGKNTRHSPALNAGFCLGISAKARDLEAAKAYLLFATRPDITLKLNLINGGIDPTRISVLMSKEYRNFAPQISIAAKAAIDAATPWVIHSHTPEMIDILAKNIRIALESRKSPDQALDDTHKQWMKLMNR